MEPINNCPNFSFDLPIGFSDSLELVLLFDGETVAGSFGGVHELVSQALGNGFDVSEGGVLGTSCDQPDGLVDSSHWGDVASLSSYATSSSDPSRVFPWASVHNSGNADLDWVLSGHNMDNLKSVLNNSHGKHLLTIIPAFLHKSINQPLNNMALGFLEPGLVEPGAVMGQVFSVSFIEFDVVSQSHVFALDFTEIPFSEHFWLVGVLFDGEIFVLGAPVLGLFLWGVFSPVFFGGSHGFWGFL